MLTYKQFNRITFPVYRLPSDNWYSLDGLLFVDSVIVDDKNQPGKTLGIRRLQTSFKNILPLEKACQDSLALIKNAAGPYIDSLGKCFLYEKTKWCALRYYRIRKVEKKEVASLLWLADIKFPFTIPRPPPDRVSWAGVLDLDGLPWLLYNYSSEYQKTTRRKV